MKTPLIHLVLLAAWIGGTGSAAQGVDFALPPVSQPGANGLVASEQLFALDDRPTQQCHASTIVETPTGLVAAWFGGSREGDPDVGIWISRHSGQARQTASAPNGSAWSPPVEVVDGTEDEPGESACWNPVLFQPLGGPLMLFYKVGLSPRQWHGMLVTSTDDGRTWTAPRKLGQNSALALGNPELQNTNLIGPVKNKPIELDDGAILCPASTEHDGWHVHFERSVDDGKTWEVIGPINDGSQFQAIQPTLLRHSNGKLQALCRTQEGAIAESWSNDGGRTWSKLAATTLPNPDSGIDAVTLQDGRQLLVYNHAQKSNGQNGRQMLNVALSSDGKKWRPVLTLENNGNRAGYSYPAVIQANDGMVHISYTWRRIGIKHVVLDPTRLALPAARKAK